MSALTDYGENQLADFARDQGLTLPASWWLALGTAADDADFTEISDSDYLRAEIPRSLTDWAGTQGAGTTLASIGSSHATSNNVTADFGNALGPVEASHVGLYDAEAGGNCWAYVELADPLVIANGDPVSVGAGALVFTLGLAGGMTNALSNRLIDLLFRAQAYTWPATLYAALYTAAPSNAGGGTEVAGSGYARAAIASSMVAWAGTQAAGSTSASTGTGGRISNNAELAYPTPTADWGVVGWEALHDAATLGNTLWWRSLASPKSILAGHSAPTHPAGSLGITWA